MELNPRLQKRQNTTKGPLDKSRSRRVGSLVPLLIALGSFPYCEPFQPWCVSDPVVVNSWLYVLGCLHIFDSRETIYTSLNHHIIATLASVSVLLLALTQFELGIFRPIVEALISGIACLIVYALPASFTSLLFSCFLVPASLYDWIKRRPSISNDSRANGQHQWGFWSFNST